MFPYCRRFCCDLRYFLELRVGHSYYAAADSFWHDLCINYCVFSYCGDVSADVPLDYLRRQQHYGWRVLNDCTTGSRVDILQPVDNLRRALNSSHARNSRHQEVLGEVRCQGAEAKDSCIPAGHEQCCSIY